MFIACGLNHKTAPLAVRETVALSTSYQEGLLTRLRQLPSVDEAVILSTCNRTEIYCQATSEQALLPWLAKECNVSLAKITPYFYTYKDTKAIEHLLAVASGLDSMMLGEPQIFGQMKRAYQLACEVGAVQHHLRQLFPYVFSASKRIRTQSGIGKNPVSIPSAATKLIRQTFCSLAPLNVLIIGSGEMASLVAKYLYKQGVKTFMVASRSQQKAEELAQLFSSTSLAIQDIESYLFRADVVISATACPLPFISKSMVEKALNQRQQQPMIFIDLAVPRDIAYEVNELTAAAVYNIDDLTSLAEKGLDERCLSAKKANALIHIELEKYKQWHRRRQAKHVICNYRSQMSVLAQQELQRALQKLSSGQCQYHVLEEFSERLVKKLTHIPTVGLKQAAEDNRKDLLDLAHYLLHYADETYPHETIN